MNLSSHHVRRAMILFYIAIFFSYLFGPLVVMSLTAFNSSTFPRVSPWECFTTQWFEQLLNDERLVIGFQRSLLIGSVVTCSSILLGLAGALLLTHVPRGVRPLYYTVLISPILIPGVVLGISTLIFWDRLRLFLGVGADSIFYDGIFLTVIGQTTFIASYCMLIFMARLQRFDSSLEEAALDLGASHIQTFRRILLPFLKPAFGSAAVIAFLASFENYNTTVFTILSKSTLTTELASKVRYGINPSISALAVIIISVTLCGAICYEVLKRREQRYQDERAYRAKMAEKLELAGGGAAGVAAGAGVGGNGGNGGNGGGVAIRRKFDGSLASVIVVLILFAGMSTYVVGNSMPNSVCQVEVKERKLERQRFLNEQRLNSLREEEEVSNQIKAGKQKNSLFGDVFAPDVLGGEDGSGGEQVKPDTPFSDVFK